MRTRLDKLKFKGDIMEELIKKLKQQARESWSGKIGEERAEALEKYLRNKTKEYSDALNISQEDILKAWEERRTYSAINYYQDCNQPSLNGGKTKVFETVEEMLTGIVEKKFRCPNCGEISTNPYECNSGKVLDKKKCDWKSYELFGCMGKGTFIFVKEKMSGETIFTPIAWE